MWFDMKTSICAWNKNPISFPNQIDTPFWMDSCIDILKNKKENYIAYGMGRSYGDCCLLNHGTILKTDQLNHFLFFNKDTGVLRVEAGITLKKILNFLSDTAWTLPVVPGTQYVTVGGAIANDVHGKNHHKAGTLGCSILKIGLLRSDTGLLECSNHMNTEFFKASIGGLGLTGLILWAEIQLKKIISPYFLTERKSFFTLAEYFALTQQLENTHEFISAWIDCKKQGAEAFRGILYYANWCDTLASKKIKQKNPITFPCYLPKKTLNPMTVNAFNQFYFYRHKKQGTKILPYTHYLFPLDNILEWNKLYGKHGFYQYQCIIPTEYAEIGIHHLLSVISQADLHSFLSVLKNFGGIFSPGIMSFPLPGCTLALDFPNRGEKTLALFEKLDAIVLQYGGRLYCAKDARMSSTIFKKMYPQWSQFSQYLDPQCRSLFWNRMML